MADDKDGGTGASIVIKKIKKGGHSAHGGAWKVAYADFVTAMMAFFLVMWIMGLDQKTKEGVQKYFNDPIKFLIGAERVNTGVFDGINGNQIVSSPNTGGLTDSQRSGGVSQLHLLARKIEAGMEAFKPEIFGLKVTPDRIQFAITAQSLFSPGSALLKSESEPLLNRIAGILKPLDANIMIEAHTDDLSPENPQFKTNWELSAVRAAVVTRYLIEGHMFEPGKLTAMGAAEYRPVADNSTPEGRAKNRRIDFYIVPDKNNRFGVRSTASEGTPPK